MVTNANVAEKNIFSSYFNCIKRYCQFRGRANRYEYWSFVLVNFVIGVILGYVEGLKGEPPVLSGAYSIFIVLPSIAAQTRRLHDTNRSGWWLGTLLLMIFIVGLIQGILEYNGIVVSPLISQVVSIIALIWIVVLFIFYVKKGNPEENKYGQPQE